MLGRRGLVLVLLAGVLACTAAPAQAQATFAARAVVRVDHPGAVIAADVHGQFSEFLGRGIYEGLWVGEGSAIPNTRGWRNDVVAALRELGVPVIRWPGGCYADRYHWRDGIGPRTQRPVRLNQTWGGAEESNAVGTHEFMDLVEQLGARAYINANVGTGAPQEAADWLEYMTSDTNSALAQERRRNGREQPWRVAYWALGNELWQCGGNMRPEHYADLYRHFATFMWAPNDRRPVLVAAGAYDTDTAWTRALMANIPLELVGAITLHHFSLPTGSWSGAKGPATGFGEADWFSIMRRAHAMDGYIRAHDAIMNRADPEQRVGLYVDEWSNWYDVEPGHPGSSLYQQNTLRDAVTAAVNLNIFHAHADRVRMANITQMVNVLQAMVLTDGLRMLRTPTYHVFRLYRPFQGAHMLPVEMHAPAYRYEGQATPSLSLSAALDADGVVHIGLANMDPSRAAGVEVTLRGLDQGGVSGQILTADAMDAHNTFDQPDALTPRPFAGARWEGARLLIEAPAKSVIVLALTPSR